MNSLLVLQNFTKLEKEGTVFKHTEKRFLSDTHQSMSEFPLSIFESVYIKTQNLTLCKQKELDTLCIISRVSACGYIFLFTFRSLSNVSYSDECRMFPLFRAIGMLSMFVLFVFLLFHFEYWFFMLPDKSNISFLILVRFVLVFLEYEQKNRV